MLTPKLRRGYIDYSLLLLLALFFCRGILFTPGIPLGADTIMWFGYQGFHAENSWWYSTWQGLGFPGVPGGVMPINVFLTFLLTIFETTIGVKLLIFATYLMAGIAMYLLVHHFFRNRNTALFAAILYMLSRSFLEQLILGHLYLSFGYAMFPLLFIVWDNLVRKRKLKHVLIAAMVFSIFITCAQLGSVYISMIFFIPFAIWDAIVARLEDRTVPLRQFLVPGVLFVASILLLSCFTIIPAIFSQGYTPWLSYRPYSMLIDTIKSASCPDLLSAITMSWIEGQDGIYAFPSVASGALLFLFPVLSFSALFFRRDRFVIFLTIAALVSVLLATGPHSPFGDVYLWMCRYVPQFAQWRVPSRWLLITAFCYSILVSVSVNAIYTSIKCSHWSFLKKSLPRLKLPLNKACAFTFMAVILFGLAAPSWPGLHFGLQSYEVPDDYLELYSYIKDQPGDFAVSNLPFEGGPGYIDPRDIDAGPVWSSTWEYGTWSSAFHGKTVLASPPSYYPYSGRFLAHAYNTYYTHQSKYLLKFLGHFNMKFLVEQPNATPFEKEFFAGQYGLRKVYQNDNGAIYENEYWEPRISASTDYILVIGGIGALNSEFSVQQSPDLKTKPLIFAAQNKDKLHYLLDNCDTLLFADGDFWDLVFLSLEARDRDYIIDASSYIDKEDDDPLTSWLLGDAYSYQGRFTSSSSGYYIYTHLDASIDFPLDIASSGEYDIWLRIFEGPVNPLHIEMDDFETELRPATMESPYLGFNWVKAGRVNLTGGEHTLRMSSTNENLIPTCVDQIALVKPSTLDSEVTYVTDLIQDHTVVFMPEQFRYTGGWYLYPDIEASDGFALKTAGEAGCSSTVYIPREGDYKVALRANKGVLYEGVGVSSDFGDDEYISLRTDYTEQSMKILANDEETGVSSDTGYVRDIGPGTDYTEQGTRILANDDQVSFWLPFNPSEQVALSNDPDAPFGISSTNSLKIDILQVGRSIPQLINKMFDPMQDLSGDKYITLWFKGTGSGAAFGLEVFFNKDFSDSASFWFLDNVDGWRYLIFPMNSPTDSQGMVDWEYVSQVRLAMATTDVTGSFYIDRLASYEDIQSAQPPFDWVYDDQVAFWLPFNPSEQVALSNDPETPPGISSANSLKIDILQVGRSIPQLINKIIDPMQDLSGDKYITLWFKGTGSGAAFGLEVFFNKSFCDSASFWFLDNIDGWRYLIFPMNSPTDSQGMVDWEYVSQVRLAMVTTDVTGSFYIGRLASCEDIQSAQPSFNEDIQSTEPSFDWVYLDKPLHLEAGEHTITLKSTGKAEVDLMAIYSQQSGELSLEDIFKSNDNANVTYEQNHETQYIAHVNTNTPFFLVFSEAYHPLWKAYVDGQEVDSIPTNGFCNGFAIDKVGEYNVSVQYIGQRYASIGAKVSLASLAVFIVCLGFLLIWDWKKRRL